MKSLERLSYMRLRLRVALVVIFLWVCVVFLVVFEVAFGELTAFERVAALVVGVLIWYIPSALLWFLVGGYREAE